MAGEIDSLTPPLCSDLGGGWGGLGTCHISEQASTFYFKVAKDLSPVTGVDHKPVGKAMPALREIALK